MMAAAYRTIGKTRLALCASLLIALATALPARAADEAARKLLPDDLRQKGLLTAAMPLDFEPFNFLDEKGEQVGLDVEIFRAIADVLGLKPEIQRLSFASIIPAVSGGRVDVGMSSMGILEQRLKQVSFVRYTKLANGLIVRKGKPGPRQQHRCLRPFDRRREGHTTGLCLGEESRGMRRRRQAQDRAADLRWQRTPGARGRDWPRRCCRGQLCHRDNRAQAFGRQAGAGARRAGARLDG
jgi:ABC-type amino acid transport substrate-binding protein